MINLPESIKDLNGAVEIILRDATTGEIVSSTFEKNIINEPYNKMFRGEEIWVTNRDYKSFI